MNSTEHAFMLWQLTSLLRQRVWCSCNSIKITSHFWLFFFTLWLFQGLRWSWSQVEGPRSWAGQRRCWGWCRKIPAWTWTRRRTTGRRAGSWWESWVSWARRARLQWRDDGEASARSQQQPPPRRTVSRRTPGCVGRGSVGEGDWHWCQLLGVENKVRAGYLLQTQNKWVFNAQIIRSDEQKLDCICAV